MSFLHHAVYVFLYHPEEQELLSFVFQDSHALMREAWKLCILANKLPSVPCLHQLMMHGDADCEGPLEGAIDQGPRQEGHHPTMQNPLLIFAAADVPILPSPAELESSL